MERVIECPCGYVLRDLDEEALIVRACEHAARVHRMELTVQQARAMVCPGPSHRAEGPP